MIIGSPLPCLLPCRPCTLTVPGRVKSRNRQPINKIAQAVPANQEQTQCTVQGGGNNFSRRKAVLADIHTRVQRLGPMSVLPGNQAVKDLIDQDLKLLEDLQQEDDDQADVSASEASDANGGMSRQRSPSILNDPRLLGTWNLMYASNGTAVTRTAGVQALVAASQLPGVGVAHIRQQLSTDQKGFVLANNAAEFGLGPLGTWSVTLIGKWLPGGSDISEAGQGVKVMFERLKIKPVGVMGVPLPKWLPEALLSLGASSEERRGAEWYTTYLDDTYRIGRGKTGNAFLFQRSR